MSERFVAESFFRAATKGLPRIRFQANGWDYAEYWHKHTLTGKVSRIATEGTTPDGQKFYKLDKGPHWTDPWWQENRRSMV